MRRLNTESVFLYEFVPSPLDDEPVGRCRSALSGLAGLQGFALEVVAADDGLRFFLRIRSAHEGDFVLSHLRAAFPQAGMYPVAPEDLPGGDYLSVSSQETAAHVDLHLSRGSAFPLDTDARHGTPLGGVLAALVANRAPGERVICQLVVGPRPSRRWANGIRARAAQQMLPYRPAPSSNQGADLLPFAVLAGIGTVGFQLYRWYQEGAFLPLVGVSGALLLAAPVGATIWGRATAGREPMPAALATEKLAFPPFSTSLRVVAIGSAGGSRKRLRRLAEGVAASYMSFDHPLGNGLRARRATTRGVPGVRVPRASSRDIMNAAELAALWHLPAGAPGLPVADKLGGRRILPSVDVASEGCRVGVSHHQGRSVPVHLPNSALFRNHLIVAKTRRGKSTLLQHIASHLMEQIDAGRERLLLVVIDPHQDLAESVLSVVPPGLEERTAYLNFTDRERRSGSICSTSRCSRTATVPPRTSSR